MKPNKRVAVLIETSRAYGRGLLHGVSRFFSENGSWSTYFEPHDLEVALPAWLKSWDGDGILARITSRKMASALAATGLPLIDLRGGDRSLGLPPFGPNNRSICEMAFEHLHRLGLEEFAFCGEPRGYHYYDDERADFFQEVVKKNGFNCHLFRHRYRKRSAKNWEKDQEHLQAWLKSLPKPIGIMACHDDRGQQLLDACRRGDLRVPEEVAVIGVDNDAFLCGLSIPSLSSIDVNSQRIGYEAALLLDRMMRGKVQFEKPKCSEPRYFEPAGVVVRQSTDIRACDDRQIASAVTFIQQNACRGITVMEVEKQIPLSRSLLNRRFKRIVGRSPKEEILRVRVEIAKQMLIDTGLPIDAISRNTGFSQSKYFTEVFRKRTGSTPLAFRKQQSRHNGLAQPIPPSK